MESTDLHSPDPSEGKAERMQQRASDVVRSVQSVLPVSEAEVTEYIRKAMDPLELKMYDLVHFLEQEAMTAHNAGAYLSACLTSASMNEAILALLCLRKEASVLQTKQFAYSTKKTARAFRLVIADWKLEQFMRVAEELRWIPADIVARDIRAALAEGFREMAPVTHPNLDERGIEETYQSFLENPGTAMLRTAQTLRNSVHAGPWLRSRFPFEASNFSAWCQFATILCGEIRNCLLHVFLDEGLEKAMAQLREIQEKMSELSPDEQKMLALFLKKRFRSAR